MNSTSKDDSDKPPVTNEAGLSIAEAEQGDAEAQFNLGLMYAKGEGVPRDDAKAAEWYRKAAEQGHAEAQNNLGAMYYDGLGVPQDYEKAAEWQRKAAEQRNGAAQFQTQLGHQESNKKTILESLGSGAFAGVVAGAAAHFFAGGKLTIPIWIVVYSLEISNAKHKFLATIVFVPVAVLVSVLLSSLDLLRNSL